MSNCSPWKIDSYGGLGDVHSTSKCLGVWDLIVRKILDQVWNLDAYTIKSFPLLRKGREGTFFVWYQPTVYLSNQVGRLQVFLTCVGGGFWNWKRSQSFSGGCWVQDVILISLIAIPFQPCVCLDDYNKLQLDYNPCGKEKWSLCTDDSQCSGCNHSTPANNRQHPRCAGGQVDIP